METPKTEPNPNSKPITGLGLAALVLGLGLVLGACAPMFEAVRGGSPHDTPTRRDTSDYERGKQELAAGRMGLAVLHFRDALAQSPDSLEALNGLGAAFDDLGRFDLSARAYGRALALAPQDAQTLNNLGYSYLLQGRYDLAVAYLREASIRGEGNARIMANRRLAELALARAGGPASIQNAPGVAGDSKADTFRPRLVHGGKGLRHLVTRPSEPVVSPDTAPPAPGRGGAPHELGKSRMQSGLLPGFISAPMALLGPRPSSAGLEALNPAP